MSNEKMISKNQEIQNKLYDEDNELFEKIMKLEDFLNSKRIQEISKTQSNLLEVQFQAMRTYHQVLRARINDLQNEIFKLSEE
uniref:Uncharacterized protein n=1 Tax=Myoviridae sp. ctCL221 TaxID=2826630 RepID=A0A8S5M6K0_9CAUD|nr:MAG TPA: hypothetical protein [Myoviridae sp. ctCL221]